VPSIGTTPVFTGTLIEMFVVPSVGATPPPTAVPSVPHDASALALFFAPAAV
jgi:hypothetical protein